MWTLQTFVLFSGILPEPNSGHCKLDPEILQVKMIDMEKNHSTLGRYSIYFSIFMLKKPDLNLSN